MKKSLVQWFFVASFLCVFLVAFTFFWASSAPWPNSKKNRIITFQYPSTKTADGIYSVLTYNLGYLSGHKNNRALVLKETDHSRHMTHVKAVLADLQPDILAFQEIDYLAQRSFDVNQQNSLAKLGYNAVAQAVNWNINYVPFPFGPPSVNFGRVVSGQSILSKYPITRHDPVVLARVKNTPFYRDAFYLDRLAQVAIIELDTRAIAIINVHLESYDRSTRAIHFEQVIDLYQKYSKKYATLLLGDFNSDPRNPNALIEQLLQTPSLGNAAFNRENIQTTYPSRRPNERIDYIFYDQKQILELSARVVEEMEFASDHLPVLLTFTFK